MFLDDPRISRVVFYPRKTKIPYDLEENIKPIKLRIDDDITIGGIQYINKKNFPTILLFHGNGEVALDYRYFYQKFFNCGVNLAVVDFRGYGFSSGEPTYLSLIEDALPIYSEFQKYLVNNDFNSSIFVQGRSLGSVCASEIGSNNPDNLKGIIFESGFASIYNMMTRLFNVSGPNITPKILEEYSNHTRVRNFKKPVLIIHGTNDFIIPLSEGEMLYESVPDKIDKKMVVIEGAGHNDILSRDSKYFSALKNFIENNK
ncbi:MAG: prolyl oligopeptidase family serine peptidase [Candidatus Lokiarchaeota archaeon]|nr:prolyl oligopeptidase family serine peptidase [Candidatus Lokiarchaeota archaeon]MBD3199214.1 prolyl oligopeptidase family serine peptidase [Candidatus Lokiarchaeota archaeon]